MLPFLLPRHFRRSYTLPLSSKCKAPNGFLLANLIFFFSRDCTLSLIVSAPVASETNLRSFFFIIFSEQILHIQGAVGIKGFPCLRVERLHLEEEGGGK